MLVWATEFPVASANGADDVLGVAKGCLVSSPHFRFELDSFGKDPENDIVRLEIAESLIAIGRLSSISERWTGLRHQYVEKREREWTTEVVAHESTQSTLVSVRLERNLLVPGLGAPSAKKPHVVKRLLEDLGGGTDAGTAVTDAPHHLAEVDVDVAERIVSGKAGHRLPVVYVSAGRPGQPSVDADQLAKWLGGMAHVFVEPSRYFSFALARVAGDINAYGGAVGIYWPNGTAVQSRFLPRDFESAATMQTEIAARVQTALTQIRPASDCTFSVLSELISRARLDALRAEGSTAVEKYIENFDNQVTAKEERIYDLEGEVLRLRAELQRFSAHDGGQSRGKLLQRGSEPEFYAGETVDALLYALGLSRNQLLSDGRRQHIVDSILRENRPTDNPEHFESEIKKAFENRGDLGAEQRRVLERLGFSVEDGGKHHKATYGDDPRYGFSVSKTGSDHRAGKNLASTIVKKLFK